MPLTPYGIIHPSTQKKKKLFVALKQRLKIEDQGSYSTRKTTNIKNAKNYIKSLIKYSKENRFGNVFIPFLPSRKVYKVTAAPVNHI